MSLRCARYSMNTTVSLPLWLFHDLLFNSSENSAIHSAGAVSHSGDESGNENRRKSAVSEDSPVWTYKTERPNVPNSASHSIFPLQHYGIWHYIITAVILVESFDVPLNRRDIVAM